MNLIKKSSVFMRKIYSYQLTSAIRKGFLLLFPLIITGSFATLLANLPIKPYQSIMSGVFGEGWADFLQIVIDSTLGIIALCLVITVSYSIAASKEAKGNERLNPATSAIVSVICFLIFSISAMEETTYEFFGTSGIFIAIITSVVATELFIYLLKRKCFQFKSLRLDEDPIIPYTLQVVLPALFVVTVFFALNQVVLAIGHSNPYQLVDSLIVQVFSKIKNNTFAAVLHSVFSQTLWFFGVHGNNMLISAEKIIFDAVSLTNEQAIAAGQLPPEILTKTFFDVFVWMGGCGSSLCLIIAIFISARNRGTLNLARISMLPAIFNISEILVFGLPVVLNPVFLIPFIFVPVIVTFISFAAIKIGLVPYITTSVDWMTPPLLNSYLATGSIKGTVLQLFNIFIGTIAYMPFVKVNEANKQKEIMDSYKELLHFIQNNGYSLSETLLFRGDNIGNLARSISKDIKHALENDGLALEYQPQVDDSNKIVGVEALLRYKHSIFGMIPPPLVIAIAEEAGFINEIGRWVMVKACRQLGEWNKKNITGITMSINISPTQLYDSMLPEVLAKSIEENNINPRDIELEITESIAVELDEAKKQVIERLKQAGVNLAMDDFGMGYTSLLYIRYFDISTIKLDGSLTRDVLKDKNCQNIISSMVFLCNSMGIRVIAEFVEEKEQMQLLNMLGCKAYQGYLFSRPLTPEKCFEFIKSNLQDKVYV